MADALLSDSLEAALRGLIRSKWTVEIKNGAYIAHKCSKEQQRAYGGVNNQQFKSLLDEGHLMKLDDGSYAIKEPVALLNMVIEALDIKNSHSCEREIELALRVLFPGDFNNFIASNEEPFFTCKNIDPAKMKKADTSGLIEFDYNNDDGFGAVKVYDIAMQKELRKAAIEILGGKYRANPRSESIR